MNEKLTIIEQQMLNMREDLASASRTKQNKSAMME